MIKTEEELIWESYSQPKVIEERSGGIEYGCLMVYLDEDSANEIRQFCQDTFNPEVLAEYGIEDEPHITCQYGFHGDVTPEEITEFINKTNNPISVNLNTVTRFENDEYDVIKVDVDSDDLHKLSDEIREHFRGRLEITFPEYHPHMTLAYVKKGSMPHVDGYDMFKGKNFVFDEFVYSDAEENKYDIKKA